MNRHLFLAFGTLLTLCIIVPLSAQPTPNIEKKLEVKPPLPPFPDSELDDVPQPPKVKKPMESKVVMRTDDTNKPHDIIMVAPADGANPTEGTIGVGFFNHSERDIVLEINNRDVKLGSKYYVQIKMPREFSWREKEGPMQKTKVPVDMDGVEIVFRR